MMDNSKSTDKPLKVKHGRRGRPKGSVDKLRKSLQLALIDNHFNVAKSMLWAYKQSKKCYTWYRRRVITGEIPSSEDKTASFLRICSELSKEMATYSYSKLKSVEKLADPLTDMNNAQKVEAMKLAIRKLEADMKMEMVVIETKENAIVSEQQQSRS